MLGWDDTQKMLKNLLKSRLLSGLWSRRGVALVVALAAPYTLDLPPASAADPSAPRLESPFGSVEFYDKTAYGYADQGDAARVIEHVRARPELAAQIGGPEARGLLFVHHYALEGSDLASAEWIWIAHTRAESDRSRGQVSILRLDFRSLEVKGEARHRVELPVPLDRSQALSALRNSSQAPPEALRHLDEDRVELVEDSYLLVQPARDFGETVVVSRVSGQVVFAATTRAGGRGELIVPQP